MSIMLLFSIFFHVKSREKPKIFVSVILFVFAVFVAYGRWLFVICLAEIYMLLISATDEWRTNHPGAVIGLLEISGVENTHLLSPIK